MTVTTFQPYLFLFHYFSEHPLQISHHVRDLRNITFFKKFDTVDIVHEVKRRCIDCKIPFPCRISSAMCVMDLWKPKAVMTGWWHAETIHLGVRNNGVNFYRFHQTLLWSFPDANTFRILVCHQPYLQFTKISSAFYAQQSVDLGQFVFSPSKKTRQELKWVYKAFILDSVFRNLV